MINLNLVALLCLGKADVIKWAMSGDINQDK